MCVAQTAKRRRRQLKLDKRWRIHSPEAARRREEQKKETARRIAQGFGKKAA